MKKEEQQEEEQILGAQDLDLMIKQQQEGALFEAQKRIAQVLEETGVNMVPIITLEGTDIRASILYRYVGRRSPNGPA